MRKSASEALQRHRGRSIQQRLTEPVKAAARTPRPGRGRSMLDLVTAPVGAAAGPARPPVVLRPASEADVDEMARFVSDYTADGTLLPRSREELARSLGDFLVAREGGELIGCGALQSVEPALSEIRTLVVAPGHRGQGIGGALLEALVEKARGKGVPRLFCLTRRVGFFARHGFAVVERERFPLKIWNDCRLCPRLESCDETAMERWIGPARGAGNAKGSP